MIYIANRLLKQGEVYKDNKNNEYYIIDYDTNLNIVKFYKNITIEMKLTKATKRYKVQSMRIDLFKKLVEKE